MRAAELFKLTAKKCNVRVKESGCEDNAPLTKQELVFPLTGKSPRVRVVNGRQVRID